MSSTHEHLRDELIALSHHLGAEHRDNIIIGEGNTSARVGDGTFWIKASGAHLGALKPDQVVRVNQQRVVSAIAGDLTDDDVRRVLGEARVDPDSAWPSIETFFHGLLYELTDAQFIGHTHPVAVCNLLCSRRAEDITRHVMPDVLIVCGLHGVFVPYVDVGATLSREIGARVRGFMADYGESPRTIYLQNHGLIALGQTARQVQNVTAMAVKHARVLAATYALGGPNFLPEHHQRRLDSRQDEEMRRAQFR